MSRSGRDPQRDFGKMTDQELANSYLELVRLRQTIRIAECGRRLQTIPAVPTARSTSTILLQ